MANFLDGDTVKKPRLAFIGCGDVAEFHARAFRAVGFDLAAVCSRPGSNRLKPFAERYGIPRMFEQISELIKARDEWDGALIAVPIDATLETLHRTLEADAPILVEKPVAWRSRELLPLTHQRLPVIVGYNRRFYRTVQAARREVVGRPPLIGHLSLPEAVYSPRRPADDPSYLRPFFGNSVHGLDMARYVFGDLRVLQVERLTNSFGVIRGLVATLATDRGDLVQFTANWQAPANFSLTIDLPGRRLQVLPFERATIYEGMEVKEPDWSRPIRSYIPKLTQEIDLDEVDHRFKPGFVLQAKAFAALIQGRETGAAATLEDAHVALELAEHLAGQLSI